MAKQIADFLMTLNNEQIDKLMGFMNDEGLSCAKAVVLHYDELVEMKNQLTNSRVFDIVLMQQTKETIL